MTKKRYCPECLTPARPGARTCDECGLGKGAGSRVRIEWLTDDS